MHGLRCCGSRASEPGRRQPVVRELGRQCHSGGFGGGNRRFDGQDGCLPTHRRRLAAAQDRYHHPYRFGGHGAGSQERISGHSDGVYSLDSAFGTAPNPGGGLPYTQVGPNHWWSGDDNSPTFNSMQVCQKAQCPFSTADSENLQIPQYKHSVVMGVNKAKVPGKGSAFFFHTTDGGPTAGCVAIDDATLVQIIRWLRPGAVIAIAK